jgi:predicted Zn-dependent protease
MRKIPKIIPPRSRVRLLWADDQPPSWKEDIGRQFRVGYYSRKDGLSCIWLVNENGEYEQTTDRKSLLKYFEIETLSQEKQLFGRARPRLRKVRVPTPLERLNGRSSLEAYEGAKEIVLKDDPGILPSVMNTLLHGQRVLNRAAAAYALSLRHAKAAISALERAVANKREHPKVRGQAAESLAHNHRPESHRILRQNLNDASKDVRFWCAYSLAEMADEEALTPLTELARDDHRVVRGFWPVGREAGAAIRTIRKKVREDGRRRKPCLFCSRKPARANSQKSRA